MDNDDKVKYGIIILLVIAILSLVSPLIIGTTVEKDITITYSDENGVIDSCNNFYSHNSLTSETITEINKFAKENDQPIKVKMYTPNKILSPFPAWLYPNTFEVVGNGIKSNSCI